MTNTTTTKITKKEMFTMIAEACADNADIVAFCEKEIASLEKRAAKSAETRAAKKVAGDALRDAIQGILTEDFMSIADVVTAIDDETVTANKVTYRLNSLVADGIAVKAEAKVEGADGKARTIKVFKLAD